jgi:GntR family transcriptional regulator/MocR family aminotransferase
MKAIIPNIESHSSTPYYLQLYSYIKEAILSGEIQADEKLPSLRLLSKNLGLSMTTVGLAYDQLSVEGYIYSRPQAGYYACNIRKSSSSSARNAIPPLEVTMTQNVPEEYYDMDCFAFSKWKKCMNKVLTDYAPQLFFESDPQGEAALRSEIAPT